MVEVHMKQSEKRPAAAQKGKPAASAKPEQVRAPRALETPPDDSMGQALSSALDNGRVRGRPATGKRSNPEWKLYSHFLRKNTQRAAVAKLQSKDDGRDLSDVLQELLEDWLKA
jgi:hypothetical protein